MVHRQTTFTIRVQREQRREGLHMRGEPSNAYRHEPQMLYVLEANIQATKYWEKRSLPERIAVRISISDHG